MEAIISATATTAITRAIVGAGVKLGRSLSGAVLPPRRLTISDTEVDELATELLERLASTFGSDLIHSSTTAKALDTYLRSPDFSLFLEHAVTSVILGTTSSWTPILLDEFLGGAKGYGALATEDAPFLTSLGTFLIQYCERIVSVQFRDVRPKNDQERGHVRHETVAMYLEAIERHLRQLKIGDKRSLSEYSGFSEQYRTAVRAGTAFLIPPNLEDRKRVPIDDLFVPPRLDTVEPSEHGLQNLSLGLATFSATTHRAVILGDPGGGKSTAATKIAYDLANGSRAISAGCPDPLLPILIVLREYGAHSKDAGGSISDFIRLTSSTKYQLEVPDGAVEWLLQSGRCFIILDGLDELLDTSSRLSITQSVEHFARRYPSCPIVVTSRKVGYRQAPLDEQMFSIAELGSFSDGQVHEYANRWFALDSQLSTTEQALMAQSFLNDSATVRDLRTNPLLLSLMCTLYRGQSYIPRNRADVYEQCAKMLFRQWDRSRGIRPELPFEAHLDPAMKDLAYWIFSDERLQAGVTQSELVLRATTYLHEHLFSDSLVEAEAAATKFVDFCRGRAWVFTDTGTTPEGQRLFQFTHRTFLEYFAAEHLSRSSASPRALLRVLLPRIRRAEWDTVSQLSVQIHNRTHAGAGEECLRYLLGKALEPRTSWDSRINILSFCARCLAFLVPTRDLAFDVATSCIRAYEEGEVAPRHAMRPEWTSLIAPLLRVARESVPAISRSVEARYLEIQAEPRRLKSLIGCLLELWDGSSLVGATIFIDGVLSEPLAVLSQSDRDIALLGTMRGLVNGGDVIKNFGAGVVFDPISAVPDNAWYPPIALSVLNAIFAAPTVLPREIVEDVLATVGPILESEVIPISPLNRTIITRGVFFEDLLELNPRRSGTAQPPWTEQQLVWSAYLLAASLEIAESEDPAIGSVGLPFTDLGPLEFVRPYIDRRFGAEESDLPELPAGSSLVRLETWTLGGNFLEMLVN